MKKTNIILTILLLVFMTTTVMYIKKEAHNSHKPIIYPFFVSTRHDITNIRTGPGTSYPKALTYYTSGYPLKVIGKHELWYNVKDIKGRTGWVSIVLTSSKQTALVIKSNTNMHISNNCNSKVVVILDKGNIVNTKQCNNSTMLCKVSIHIDKQNLNFSGWILRAHLWGGTVGASNY